LQPPDCSAYIRAMLDHTDVFHAGDHAPDFTLAAANRDGNFSLAQLLSGRALVLEFLRGTW